MGPISPQCIFTHFLNQSHTSAYTQRSKICNFFLCTESLGVMLEFSYIERGLSSQIEMLVFQVTL